MLNTGIVRKIDDLGRIVIPIEIRKTLNIRNGDSIKISINDNEIILKKFNKMLTFVEASKKYISIILKEYDVDFWITDNNNVLFNTIASFNKNVVDNLIKNLIMERKKVIDYTINFVFNEKVYQVIMVPIIIEGSAIGSILMDVYKDIESSKKLIYMLLNLILLEIS